MVIFLKFQHADIFLREEILRTKCDRRKNATVFESDSLELTRQTCARPSNKEILKFMELGGGMLLPQDLLFFADELLIEMYFPGRSKLQ